MHWVDLEVWTHLFRGSRALSTGLVNSWCWCETPGLNLKLRFSLDGRGRNFTVRASSSLQWWSWELLSLLSTSLSILFSLANRMNQLFFSKARGICYIHRQKILHGRGLNRLKLTCQVTKSRAIWHVVARHTSAKSLEFKCAQIRRGNGSVLEHPSRVRNGQVWGRRRLAWSWVGSCQTRQTWLTENWPIGPQKLKNYPIKFQNWFLGHGFY